jgi:hypothetical protein
VHAELVAFGVAHHISERALLVMSLNEFGSKVREPGDLFSLAVRFDMDVEVDPVLRESTPCGSRHAVTSRDADRPLIVMRSAAGMRPSATSWSTKSEGSSTSMPRTLAQNAARACGSAASKVT